MMSIRNAKAAPLEKSLSQQLKSVTDLAADYENIPENELFEQTDFYKCAAESVSDAGYSYWKSTMRSFRKNKAAVLFLGIIVILLVFTFVQPFLPGQRNPKTINDDPVTGVQIINRAPDREYWFGTNSIGQDLWARTWSGARTSLFIGCFVAVFEAVFGTIVGILWGYCRKLDWFFTEMYNIFDNIPQTLVLILFSYIMRPGVGTIIFALCLTGWLETARFIRNQIIIIRDREYNLASRCMGVSAYRIITKNILPYLVSVIALRMALAIPSAIGSEVFVTYIGIGLPTDIPSLGNLVSDGFALMSQPDMRYQLLFPTALLSIITISFYVIGNAFADAADPKNHV